MGLARHTPSALDVLLARPDIRRGGAVGVAAHAGVSTGFAALDAVLPGRGWPAGCLTELLPSHAGIGELRLLGSALAALARSGAGLAWIAPPYLPYAPALAAAGIWSQQLPVETLWQGPPRLLLPAVPANPASAESDPAARARPPHRPRAPGLPRSRQRHWSCLQPR